MTKSPCPANNKHINQYKINKKIKYSLKKFHQVYTFKNQLPPAFSVCPNFHAPHEKSAVIFINPNGLKTG